MKTSPNFPENEKKGVMSRKKTPSSKAHPFFSYLFLKFQGCNVVGIVVASLFVPNIEKAKKIMENTLEEM